MILTNTSTPEPVSTQLKHPKEILDLTIINANELTYRITFIISTSHDQQQLYTIDSTKTTTINNVILHPKYWIDYAVNSESALLFTLTKLPNNAINITLYKSQLTSPNPHRSFKLIRIPKPTILQRTLISKTLLFPLSRMIQLSFLT